MKTITTTQAIVVAADHGCPVTRVTMINWAIKYAIGSKIGGRWHIHEDLLMAMLEGKK
jgi:hypothetical protein